MWLNIFILLAGFAVRAAPLTENRFHPDEALYATFARLIASGRDPLLSNIVVDKPPLPFYLMAASMAYFGGTEFAARLPHFLAGVVCVALVFQLGKTLFSARAGWVASVAFALSPLAILFAITLFTDTLLTAFLLWSLLAATRRRWAQAGWAFGLAFACKQSALFALPLLLAVYLIEHARSPIRPRLLARFFLPIAVCAAAIFVWDAVRHAPISFWAQGISDNNPNRLIRANELRPRLAGWVELLKTIFGSRLLEALFVLGVPVYLATRRRARASLYAYCFAGWALTFLAGYWLLAFNVWDRYLLMLTPIAALLLGATTDAALNRLPQTKWLRAAPVIIAVAMLNPALVAARSGYPVGGDHGAYDGIDHIARALYQAPPRSVLYDHWLSWQWGFYLFDSPVYLAWFPGPESLADDLQAFGHTSPRFIVAPSWESFAEVQAAIGEVGFEAQAIETAYRRDGSLSFTLYQLVPIAPP